MEVKRRSLKHEDPVIEALVSTNLGMNLLQNCDLPPPMKVFPRSMVRVPGWSGREDEGLEEGKMELLKALRLSQTRAREAERKVEQLAAEREQVSDALLRESLKLSAHRHWVRLLEMQVLKMKTQQKQKQKQKQKEAELDETEIRTSEGISWLLALALCIGISFGCTYF